MRALLRHPGNALVERRAVGGGDVGGRVGFAQSGDHAQQGRLADPAGPENTGPLAGGDVRREVLE
jgi:hypothetical protein